MNKKDIIFDDLKQLNQLKKQKGFFKKVNPVPPFYKAPKLYKEQGIGLIEVLIAMVVASLGLLGIAAALMLSLKHNQSSLEHSSAVNQAYAMMEIVRADRPNAIIGRYNLNSFTCNNVSGDNAIGATQNIWLEALRSEVNPTACGQIVCSSASCRVSVRWDDSRMVDTDENGVETSSKKTYSLETRL